MRDFFRFHFRRSLIILFDILIFLSLTILFPLSIIKILVKRKISVWTGEPIINLGVNARSEKLLGVRSFSLVHKTYFVTSKFDFVLSEIVKNSKPLIFLFRYLACLIICLLASRVHVYVDGGILPQRKPRIFNPMELFLYKLFGVKIFVWTYGADVRTYKITKSLGRFNCCSDCPKIGFFCICDNPSYMENYNRLKRHAKAIFSMGDMLEYTPGSINNLFYWPVDILDDEQKYLPEAFYNVSNRPIRIVHAPNNREFKGTRYLENAVNNLKAAGIEIELVLVEGLPNIDALEIYKTADIIFDQCLIGFHGYFALEAMALGKPVMAYIRNKEKYLLDCNSCPLINTELSTIESNLRYYAQEGRVELDEIGKQSRKYIEKYYTPHAFSKRLKKAYDLLGVQ